MGYNLYITRKKSWLNDTGPEISAEEWLAYVATDSQLHPDFENGKYRVRIEIPSRYPDAWLDWNDGCIYTKNPDPPIIAKMLQIASVLNAKVQGDDGEIY